MHADGFCVCAGVEDHLRLSDEAVVHEHAVTVHRAERRHGAHFALRVHRGYLFLGCQAQRDGIGELAEQLEIHHVVRRKDRLHRLVVSDANDDLRPASLRDVRHGCLFLRRVGREMSEAGIGDPSGPQQVCDPGQQRHDVPPLAQRIWNVGFVEIADDGRREWPISARNAVRYTPSRTKGGQLFSESFSKILCYTERCATGQRSARP